MMKSIQRKISAQILYVNQHHNKTNGDSILVSDGSYTLLGHNQLTNNYHYKSITNTMRSLYIVIDLGSKESSVGN